MDGAGRLSSKFKCDGREQAYLDLIKVILDFNKRMLQLDHSRDVDTAEGIAVRRSLKVQPRKNTL